MLRGRRPRIFLEGARAHWTPSNRRQWVRRKFAAGSMLMSPRHRIFFLPRAVEMPESPPLVRTATRATRWSPCSPGQPGSTCIGSIPRRSATLPIPCVALGSRPNRCSAADVPTCLERARPTLLPFPPCAVCFDVRLPTGLQAKVSMFRFSNKTRPGIWASCNSTPLRRAEVPALFTGSTRSPPVAARRPRVVAVLFDLFDSWPPPFGPGR